MSIRYIIYLILFILILFKKRKYEGISRRASRVVNDLSSGVGDSVGNQTRRATRDLPELEFDTKKLETNLKKTDSGDVESTRTGNGDVESTRTGNGDVESTRTGNGDVESSRTGNGDIESTRTGNGDVESKKAVVNGVEKTSSWKKKLMAGAVAGSIVAGLAVWKTINDKKYKDDLKKYEENMMEYLSNVEKLEQCVEEANLDNFEYCLEKKPDDIPEGEDFIDPEKIQIFNRKMRLYTDCCEQILEEEDFECEYNQALINNPPVPPARPNDPLNFIDDEISDAYGGIKALFGDMWKYIKWGGIILVIIIILFIIYKIYSVFFLKKKFMQQYMQPQYIQPRYNQPSYNLDYNYEYY